MEDIRQLVRGLWHLLDPLLQDDLASGVSMLMSQVISTSTKIDDLLSLQKALNTSYDDTSRKGFIQQSSSALASAAGIKAFKAALDESGDGRSIGTSGPEDLPHMHSLRIDEVGHHAPLEKLEKAHIKDFVLIKGMLDMGVASYERESIFVEWKDMPVQNRSKSLVRAENLARLLKAPKHANFSTLSCRGIARDNDASKIAFVYALKQSPGISSPPRSLRALFLSAKPSITDRIRLAIQVTRTMQCFHTAGWLHKNLRSENFLFFPDQGLSTSDSNNLTLANPILTGFGYSRFNSPLEISEQPSSDPQRDIYRHPDAMGEPAESFDKNKDLYALGTVLLEIGEWRSLRSVVADVINLKDANVRLDQLANVRPFLLQKGSSGGLKELRYRMGDIYEDATRMLLEGEISEDRKRAKKTEYGFVPEVLDIAVSQLERCVI